MKYLILPLIFLISCDEEEIRKSYAGTYTYESEEIKFRLTLTREHGIYQGERASVDHEAISHTEGRDNLIILRYSSIKDSYDQIIIRSHTPVTWSVNLDNVRLTDEGMITDQIQVIMPGHPELLIEGQTIRRLNL